MRWKAGENIASSAQIASLLLLSKMMRSEKALWQTLKKALTFCFYQRIEDALARGIPDLFFTFRHNLEGVSGWIELKEALRPLRGKVDVGLKDWQRHWLIRSGLMGSNNWLLVQIGGCYFFYNWSQLVELDVNNLTYQQHRKMAWLVTTKLSKDVVKDILLKGNIYTREEK